MWSRLKEDGIATFWLPINQLKWTNKGDPACFHNAFLHARCGLARIRT